MLPTELMAYVETRIKHCANSLNCWESNRTWHCRIRFPSIASSCSTRWNVNDGKSGSGELAPGRGTLTIMLPTNRSQIRAFSSAAVAVAGIAAICCSGVWAAPVVSFAEDIQPILKARCYRCHGEKTQKADLNLASAKRIQRGSESGMILDAGNPNGSRLLEVVQDGEMPPEDEGQKLSTGQIELIRRWIEQGADFGAEEFDVHAGLNQHDVLPILLLRCATCHGRQKQEAGLDLRTKASMLKGGKSGPAIVPGEPNASLIIKKIKAEQMPPRPKLASHSVKPVEPQELERLIKWIELGAPEVDIPADVASTEPDPLVSDEDRSFWSFQPPRPVAIPSLNRDSTRIASRHAHDSGRLFQDHVVVRNPIDAFVLDGLRDVGLDCTSEASRQVLLRRAYFDLIGLPPPPEEIESFLVDDDPNAYEQLIDRLLVSPRYGERWGQYWLDLAGYSDSEGVQHSDPIRPHAYRYRDYVIRSFNADKPYDRFLIEQIAGDELANYENASVITEQLYDNLVATGFLRMTADGTFAGITGFVPNRLDVIDDQLRILSSSVMGLTVRCARCHSHKFDPIPQRDYYRLVALLKPAMDEHDWLKPVTGGSGNTAGSYRYLPVVTTAERQAWDKLDAQLNAKIEQLKSELKEHEDDEEFTAATLEKIKSLESKRVPEPMIRALWDRGEPSPTYLLRRGDYLQPTRLLGPGVPSVLTDGKTSFDPEPPWPGAKKTGNRWALAKWLTQPDHPLTARVMVNRIWKHHFGRGIVQTLDDFGRAGARPSHPALLDWLAIEFVRSGWSIKHMHRLIMTAATYRRASASTSAQQGVDPENRLLSHMPLRRMEAEELRDTLLAISGQLDLTPYGPPDGVSARADGLVVSTLKSSGRRRSIYVLKRRTQRLTILDNFDRPAMSPNCVDRPISIVAPQALHLMNNIMVHAQSLSLADRILAAAGNDDKQRIRRLYLIAVGRPPSDNEQATMLAALYQLSDRWRDKLASEEKDAKPTEVRRKATKMAFGNLCHAIMNSAAFLYVD